LQPLVICICRAEDVEEFTEEQSLMGRLVHLFRADSADQQYQVSYLADTVPNVGTGTIPFLSNKCF
jgi:hypothetical protein